MENLKKISKTVLLNKIRDKYESNPDIIKNDFWSYFINSIEKIEYNKNNDDEYMFEDLIIKFVEYLIKSNQMINEKI